MGFDGVMLSGSLSIRGYDVAGYDPVRKFPWSKVSQTHQWRDRTNEIHPTQVARPVLFWTAGNTEVR